MKIGLNKQIPVALSIYQDWLRQSDLLVVYSLKRNEDSTFDSTIFNGLNTADKANNVRIFVVRELFRL